MQHEIEVKIDETGNLECEVLGIKGSACEVISAWLDQLGKVKEHSSTKDRYKDPNVLKNLTIRN